MYSSVVAFHYESATTSTVSTTLFLDRKSLKLYVKIGIEIILKMDFSIYTNNIYKFIMYLHTQTLPLTRY